MNTVAAGLSDDELDLGEADWCDPDVPGIAEVLRELLRSTTPSPPTHHHRFPADPAQVQRAMRLRPRLRPRVLYQAGAAL